MIGLFFAGLLSSAGEPDMLIGYGGLGVVVVGGIVAWRGGLLLKGESRSALILAVGFAVFTVGLGAWWFLLRK